MALILLPSVVAFCFFFKLSLCLSFLPAVCSDNSEAGDSEQYVGGCLLWESQHGLLSEDRMSCSSQ